MEQVISALPDTRSLLSKISPWLFPPDPIALEIISLNQVTSFQINLPSQFAHYLKAQLVAAYPELIISQAQEAQHSLEPLFSQGMAVANLKLKAGSNYPIKTYKEFSDTDPLSAILGTLSKLSPKQACLIQILLAVESDSWKKAGFKLAEGYTDSEGKNITNPDKTIIETKLNQTCLRTGITIATSAPSKQEARDLLSQVTGSFAAITDAKSNSLVASKPLLGLKQLALSLPHRNYHKTVYQHLAASEIATIFHLPYKDIKDIKNIAWGRSLLGEPPENLPTYAHSSETEREGINLFAQTEFKNETQIFGIKDIDRRRHMYVIGKSGTGKSTLLANMIINDLKRGKGLAVVDPHGDLVETVLDFIPSNRINDVVYLNPADPEYTVRMNLLEDTGTAHKELIASGIIAIFQKLYAHSWGPRLEYILRNTLLTLVEKDQSTMEDVVKILTNAKFRQKVVEKINDPVLKNFWVDEFAHMGDKLRAEAVSPILNKIGQFVTSPLIRNVINYPTSSFDLADVMDNRKILLANLSQGKLGEDNATLLGAMLITKIQLTAMNRVYVPEEQRQDFYLYVDEFQNFATSSFIKILSEARKYRLSLILANQYIDQVDMEVRKAIFGNAATLATFLVGAQDASLLSAEFGQQYTPEDLVSIGKHQVVLKLSVDGMTSVPFPAYTLPLASSTNQNREKVIKVSNERYAKRKVSFDPKDPVNQAVKEAVIQTGQQDNLVDQNTNQYIASQEPEHVGRFEREPLPGRVKQVQKDAQQKSDS